MSISGKELLRVDYKNGGARIIGPEKLQDKKHRYYLKNTLKLTKDNVYISPFDLNVENGEIEKPHKPMIRISSLLIDKKKRKKGMVVLNYLGKIIIDRIIKLSSENVGKIILLNSQGYWLRALNPKDEWGFMFPDKKNISFKNRYPKQWQIISNNDSGRLERVDKSILIFDTVIPYRSLKGAVDGEGKQYKWKIVSIIFPDILESLSRGVFLGIIFLNSALAIVFAFVSFHFSKMRLNRKLSEKVLIRYSKELEKSNQLKELFTDIMRHDLLNPAGVIQSSVELLKEEERSREDLQLLDAMDRSIEKMISMIENAAFYAKLEKIGEIDFQECDIKQMINEALSNLSYLLREMDMKVSINGNGDYLVLVNPMLMNVFMNIISNSIKYSGESKKIDIDISIEEEKLLVCIKDWGPGIPKEKQDRLFTRFERLDKKNIKGSGLGLAIVKKIIELHNGKIWLEDNDPSGCIFCIQIPVGKFDKA